MRRKIWMTVENHAKQIVSFSFMPICCSPYTGDCRHVRIFFVQQDLQTKSMMLGGREKMVIDFKAGLFFYTAIRAADIRQKIKTRVRPCFQK